MAVLTPKDLEELMSFVEEECQKPPATSVYFFGQEEPVEEANAPEEATPADPRKEPEPEPKKCWMLPVPVFEKTAEPKDSHGPEDVPIDPRKKPKLDKNIIDLPVPVFETAEKTHLNLAPPKENPDETTKAPLLPLLEPPELKKDLASNGKRKFSRALDAAYKKMRLQLKDFKIPRVNPGDSKKKRSSKEKDTRYVGFFKENSKEITIEPREKQNGPLKNELDENFVVILHPGTEDSRYVFGIRGSKFKRPIVDKQSIEKAVYKPKAPNRPQLATNDLRHKIRQKIQNSNDQSPSSVNFPWK